MISEELKEENRKLKELIRRHQMDPSAMDFSIDISV